MNLLNWAENLCQKLEKACTESEVVQVPCRYVDAISNRIKHVLDELNDYVNLYDSLSDETDSSDVSLGCTESVVESDLSFMEDEGSSHHQNIHETDSSDVCEDYMESTVESNISFMEDEGSTQNIHEPYFLESAVESNISSSEDEGSTQNIHELDSLDSTEESNVSSSNSEDLKFPDRLKDDSNISESVNSSKTIGSKNSDENTENIKNDEHIVSSMGELSLITSSGPKQELSRQIRCDELGSADVTHFPESSHNITPSEFNENELIDEVSIGLDTTSLTETHENCMSQETVSLLRSLADEHDQQHDLNKVDAHEQLSETETGILMDSFEDVNLNTCWEDAEDAENFELVMTSKHVSKESLEKMKLKNIFISKVLAAKRKKKTKNQSYATDIEINAQSSNSIEDSCGSDWVLL